MPTGDYYLLYSGNEKSCVALAKPAPRGHRAVGKGLPGLEMTGGSLWRAMYESALRLGVKFEMASRVEELLVDSQGRVTGVRYRQIQETTSWASSPYKWLAGSAKGWNVSFPPLADAINYVADTMWNQAAKSKSLEADAVILAAGGFVCELSQVCSSTRTTVITDNIMHQRTGRWSNHSSHGENTPSHLAQLDAMVVASSWVSQLALELPTWNA